MNAQIGFDAKQKALRINLDSSIYGSFAEIGAGQEVVRHFFRAGGAAGTVAKTMSAYDMKFSDDIYGKEPSGRYVSQKRLEKMLDHEFRLLEERLNDRCDETRFFAFADTVAAKSYRGKGECHGWLGLKFQHESCKAPSVLKIHVKMFDRENLQQQEALGLVGVNLITAAYYRLDNRESFVKTLMEGIGPDRIEIDYINLEGPAFENVDARLYSLELVKNNFCQAVIFDEKGEVLQASDALYKKNVLVCRGSYRPPTLVNIDMLDKGLEAFKKDVAKNEIKDILILPEISMSKLASRDGGNIDNEDFLARVELLNGLGHNVMISNYEHFSELNDFIKNYNRGKVGIVLGHYNLYEVFDDKVENVLHLISRMVGKNSTVYVYPAKDNKTGKMLCYDDLPVDKSKLTLLEYLEQDSFFKKISNHNEKVFGIWSREVMKMITSGTDGWEKMVPESVAKNVKENSLFGLKKRD